MAVLTCPYPALGPEHPTSSSGTNTGTCEVCRKPLMYCARCGQANRLLARFCRGCGLTRPELRWSMRGGEADSFVHNLTFSGEDLAIRYSTQLPEAIAVAPLLLSGLFIGVSRQGTVYVMRERIAEPLWSGALEMGEIMASPGLLDGLLLVAAGNRLKTVDLVHELDISPESPVRDRVVSLSGSVCSDVASDGRRYAAVAAVEQGKLTLHLFTSSGESGLQPVWSRSPAYTAAETLYGLAFRDGLVMLGEPAGRLWVWSVPEGNLLAELRLDSGLAPQPLVSRKSSVLAAGGDGRMYRILVGEGKLQAVCVADSVGRPLFGFGASEAHIVSCHGRLIRHTRLSGGTSVTLELPQPCTLEPLLGQNVAVLLSDEGSIYMVDLMPGADQVARYRKVFTSSGAMPVPPVATSRTLFVCGPQGELASVAWGRQT
ncbi:MAG: hypothetical protein ACYCW6_14430 [Candidatus Xenobia bacterium]